MTENTPTTTTTQAPALSSFATRNNDLWKLAQGLCRSDLVPAQFRGKPENTFLALQMSDRMELDMFAVMSNLFVVHGTPAFSSKFLIGLANMRGPFRGNLKFRFTGEGTAQLAATCYATLRETGEEVSTTVTLAQATAAGWTKNPKYKEIGSQMLAYRAAAFFVRLYCPEVAIMGARTVDEVEDMYAAGGATSMREATVVRTDPLAREIESTNGAQPPREVAGEGETVPVVAHGDGSHSAELDEEVDRG